MPTCAVTNCWKPAVDFNVGDRLRGSYCEDHQDVAQEQVHGSPSAELDRFGDAASREGIESDTTETRGEEREGTIPPAEKSGEVSDRSAAVTPAGETVSKELDS
jgi:hypothetical protein